MPSESGSSTETTQVETRPGSTSAKSTKVSIHALI
jgi:hypothetical protein